MKRLQGLLAQLYAVARTAVAPTEDLLTPRLASHEKAAWMLRSLLAEERPTAIA